MNSRHIGVLSATVMALLALSGAAKAAGKCSLATLNGAYGFSAQGHLIGLLDSAGGVHPFVTQQVLNDVALVTFDGSGHFTRIDTGTVGGAPKGGQTVFVGNQTGLYTVKSDCTGTMTIQYNNGVVLLLNMVVTDDARVVKAIIITETLPSAGPTIDNTPCQAPCAEAVEVSFDGRKVGSFESR